MFYMTFLSRHSGGISGDDGGYSNKIWIMKAGVLCCICTEISNKQVAVWSTEVHWPHNTSTDRLTLDKLSVYPWWIYKDRQPFALIFTPMVNLDSGVGLSGLWEKPEFAKRTLNQGFSCCEGQC